MIPIKLAMRNFMCYRDKVPALDFNGIHLACISGNNGSGKSALIDAITWALWGQARASSDNDLVYTGQAEMEVEFEFAVEQQRYRILRKYSKPKSAGRYVPPVLEFQIASDSGFKTISGDNSRQTQQKIIQTLHMDYDTFINSAFLKQGHADEFTKKRPGERKEILASILQLSVYDELEEKAKNMAKEREAESNQLESAIKEIDDELSQQPAYQMEFEQAQQELAQAEKQSAEQEGKLVALRKKRETLEAGRAQFAEIETRITDTAINLNRWEEQIRQHQSQIQQYEAIIAQRPGIEAGYKQFQETKEACHEFDQKLKRVNTFIDHKHRLELFIEKAGAALVTEHAVLQSRIRELENVSHRLQQLHAELELNTKELHALTEREKELDDRRQKNRELRARVNYLEAEKDRLKKEIADIAEKLGMLTSQAGVKCPLCETELGETGRQRIESTYLAEKEAKTAALAANQSEMIQKEAEAKSSDTDISRGETKLNRDKVAIQSKVNEINRQMSEAETAASRVSEEEVKRAEIEGHLASGDFAVAEKERLSQIEDEIAKLGYAAEKHEALRSLLANLEPFSDAKHKLDEADRLLVQEKEIVAKAEVTVRELRLKLEADNGKKAELNAVLNGYAGVMDNLAKAESQYQALLLRQNQAQGVLGGVKVKLERCAELNHRRSEKKTFFKQTSREEGVFQELALAFGKKGLQAMLIERAIPEIEYEANKLLARMTDNRMQVKMETQRETKKGDVVETLDINISDELGTRSYEMFSGGEAFRIDFAIRIALSRLLAHRAGASLPTLIIDEGFGTQDSAGIEKIKEALNSIQDDFLKILVITHVAELRDAFPTRIEVVKESQGSMLYLN